MSDHFDTAGGWPQTREEVRALADHRLHDFMAQCPVEPADFDGCLACYAYQVAQERERLAIERSRVQLGVSSAEAAAGADRVAEIARGAGVALRDDVPPPEVLGDPPIDVDAAIADATVPGGQAPWTPASLGEAEWAMGMVRGLDAELAGLRAQAQAWREHIDQWLADATRQPERRRAFFEQALTGYADQWRAEDDHRRTLPLPSGEVRATVPQSGTVVVTDEAALLRWLRRQVRHLQETGEGDEIAYLADAAIKHTPDTVRLPELRRLVKADRTDDGTWRPIVPLTGERPPGVAVEPPGEPRYQVKPTQ